MFSQFKTQISRFCVNYLNLKVQSFQRMELGRPTMWRRAKARQALKTIIYHSRYLNLLTNNSHSVYILMKMDCVFPRHHCLQGRSPFLRIRLRCHL